MWGGDLSASVLCNSIPQVYEPDDPIRRRDPLRSSDKHELRVSISGTAHAHHMGLSRILTSGFLARQAEREAMESEIRRRSASSAPGTSPGGASSGRSSPPPSASASASSGPVAPARRRSLSPDASKSSRGGLRSSSSSLSASPSMDPAYLEPTPTPEVKGRRPSAMASSPPMSRGTPNSSARGAPQSAGGTPNPCQKSGACSSGGQTPNPRKLSESPPREAASPSPEQASGTASPMAWQDASLIASAAVGVGPAPKADVSCPVVEASSSSSSSLSTGEGCKQGESRADSAAAVRGAEWRDASMLASAFLRETAPISVEADVVAAGGGRGDRVDREASGVPFTERAEVEKEAGGVPITEQAVVQDGGQTKMAIAGSGSNSNSNSNSVSPSARASSPSPSGGQADASRLLDSVYLRPSASPEARATAGHGQGQSVLWESVISVPGQGMSGSVMSVGGEETLVASAREEMSRVISSRGSSPERGDWMGSGAPDHHHLESRLPPRIPPRRNSRRRPCMLPSTPWGGDAQPPLRRPLVSQPPDHRLPHGLRSKVTPNRAMHDHRRLRVARGAETQARTTRTPTPT
jgi:hypothetical protein